MLLTNAFRSIYIISQNYTQCQITITLQSISIIVIYYSVHFSGYTVAIDLTQSFNMDTHHQYHPPASISQFAFV